MEQIAQDSELNPIPVKKNFSFNPMKEETLIPQEVMDSAFLWYVGRLKTSVRLAIVADYLSYKSALLEEENK